ncbi:ADAMTS-like protein 4 [Rhea pennata]|uniref:ADAMTS-like protein 4 n=1 Tax=Rhea pennata TaxID=8795 RepID=UPI002E26C7B4
MGARHAGPLGRLCVCAALLGTLLRPGPARGDVPRWRQAAEEPVGPGPPWGAWAPWGAWGPCSEPCGPGLQRRSRECLPPLPWGAPAPWPGGPPHGAVTLPLFQPGAPTAPPHSAQPPIRPPIRPPVRPGRYGYGKAPFALPLLTDEAPRRRRHLPHGAPRRAAPGAAGEPRQPHGAPGPEGDPRQPHGARGPRSAPHHPHGRGAEPRGARAPRGDPHHHVPEGDPRQPHGHGGEAQQPRGPRVPGVEPRRPHGTPVPLGDPQHAQVPTGDPQHPHSTHSPKGDPQHPHGTHVPHSDPQHAQVTMGDPQHPHSTYSPKGDLQHPPSTHVPHSDPQHPQVPTGDPQHPQSTPVPTGDPQHPHGAPVPTGDPQHPPGSQIPSGDPQHPHSTHVPRGGSPVPTGDPQYPPGSHIPGGDPQRPYGTHVPTGDPHVPTGEPQKSHSPPVLRGEPRLPPRSQPPSWGQGRPRAPRQRQPPGAEPPWAGAPSAPGGWSLYAVGPRPLSCPGESQQLRACHLQACPPAQPPPAALQCAALDQREFLGRRYHWEPFEGTGAGGGADWLGAGGGGVGLAGRRAEPIGWEPGAAGWIGWRRAEPIGWEPGAAGCDGVLGSAGCRLLAGNASLAGHRHVAAGGNRVAQAAPSASHPGALAAALAEAPVTAASGPGAGDPPLRPGHDPRGHRHHRHHRHDGDGDGDSDGDGDGGVYWKRVGTTPCSATCGQGSRQPLFRCVARRWHEEVAEGLCAALPRPPAAPEPCDGQPCPAYWDAGEWSPCSRSCGPGTQHRPVLCRQAFAHRSTLVHPRRCAPLPRPDATQPCQLRPCSRWEVLSDWSPCSAPCGQGQRSRRVRCASAEGAELSDAECPGAQRPSARQPCDMGPCARAWFLSDWSEACSAECGPGTQRRAVLCLASGAEGQPGGGCVGAEPPATRACDGGPCRRTAAWYTGPWSPCSAECGPGTRRRDVLCVSKLGAAAAVAEGAECGAQPRPPALQPCAAPACPPRWFTTAWSACSRSCLGGVQTRAVHCLTPNKTLSTRCPPHLRPASQQPCNPQPCAPHLDAGCRDEHPSCAAAARARLCAYPYYGSACCAACARRPPGPTEPPAAAAAPRPPHGGARPPGASPPRRP